MEMSQLNKRLFYLFIILFVLIGITIYLVVSMKEESFSATIKKDSIVEVLFVVHDEEKNVLSTDVVIYYGDSNKGAILDIVGNIGDVYEVLKRTDRIDAIYKEHGIEAYKSQIEKLTDKTIPFSVELSVRDFSTLTDILGGIKVFVPSPVNTENEDGDKLLLPSGGILLDGDKLNVYLDYLLSDEDSSAREERRRLAFISLLQSIRENRNTIFQKRNFKNYAKQFKTNLNENDFYTIMEQISNLEVERLPVKSVTGTLTTTTDGKKLLFPSYSGKLFKQIVSQTINSLVSEDASTQSRVYELEILNGTSRQGLARNTSIFLQGAGYKVFEASNADNDDYEHTVIINHIGNEEACKALADFITCKNIIDEEVKANADDNSVATADFTIILGRDFDGRYVRGGYSQKNESAKE